MLFGSFCSFVYAGFALDLFWFLAIGNTDFPFPSFGLRFFQFNPEGFAQDFIIPSVRDQDFFLDEPVSPQSLPCDPPLILDFYRNKV